MRGWYRDPYRHSLAARGIMTKREKEISAAIKIGMRTWRYRNPANINKGHCDQFACALVRYLGFGKVRMADEYDPPLPKMHWWVYYKGKHYDAEAPNGVMDVWDLPFYKRYSEKHGKYKVRHVGLR